MTRHVAGKVRELQAQQAAIRRLPITAQLRGQLKQAAKVAGVEADIFSGGQPARGQLGRRTGSTRHDGGRAADLRLYIADAKSGRRVLDSRLSKDRKIMAKFVEESVAAGATGVGHGGRPLVYMGASSIHVGGGTAASWGGAGPWFRQAWQRGMTRQRKAR